MIQSICLFMLSTIKGVNFIFTVRYQHSEIVVIIIAWKNYVKLSFFSLMYVFKVIIILNIVKMSIFITLKSVSMCYDIL